MRIAAPALLVIAVLVLFTGFSSVGFLDEREARHLAVAANLRQSAERLTPLLGSDPVLERPLLAYALDLAVAGIPNDDPTIPRAVRGLAALALVAVTGWLGGRHFGARSGWLAALVLLTSLGTPVAARTDGPQLLGSLFGWLACLSFMQALFGDERRRGWALTAAWTSIGFALLAAGPLPALWPIGGLALYLGLVRQPHGWRVLAPAWGALIVIGMALPWYGAMIDLHRGAFAARMAWFPYAGPSHASLLGAPVVAASLLLAAAFPWCALLPGALMHADAWWRSEARRGHPRGPHSTGPISADLTADPAMVLIAVEEQMRFESQSHLIIAWLAAAAATLVLYPQPPMSAALAALPAVALLCGRLLDHALERPERVRAAIAGAGNTLALVGIPFAIFVAMMASRSPAASHPVRLVAILLLVTSAAPFLAMFAGRPRVSALLFAVPVMLGAPLVACSLLPAYEDSMCTRRIAAAMISDSPASAAVVLPEAPPSSLRLYLDRTLVVTDSLARELPRERASDGHTYLMFRPAREEEVIRVAGAPLEVLMRTPELVLARVRVP